MLAPHTAATLSTASGRRVDSAVKMMRAEHKLPAGSPQYNLTSQALSECLEKSLRELRQRVEGTPGSAPLLALGVQLSVPHVTLMPGLPDMQAALLAVTQQVINMGQVSAAHVRACAHSYAMVAPRCWAAQSS